VPVPVKQSSKYVEAPVMSRHAQKTMT